jgi:hypothetical protein
MTYSGSVVLKKIFKWTSPIFAFLWLSPFWRGPGPLFEQFRIPYTYKNDLCQVWLKLACWFWRRRFFFFNWYKHMLNLVFSFVAPTDPRGPWYEQFWIYIISERFHVNMTYSGLVVLKKKIFFNEPTPFLHFWDNFPFEEDLAFF